LSTTDNPYTPPPPTTVLDAEPGQRFASKAEVPRSVIDLLSQTRPWVKLLAVMFFVFLGLAVLVVIVMAAVTPVQAKVPALIPMLVVLLLYIAPAVYLSRYARGIQRLLDGGGQGALEEALTNQKSFWKFSGVLALIMMCIYAIALVGGGFAAFLHMGSRAAGGG
jgi:hypothetical protein